MEGARESMEGALIEDDQSDDDAQKTICCGACTEDAEEELAWADPCC